MLAVKIPGCLGLIRGKSSLGLRLHQDNFDQAWTTLWSGTQPPVAAKGDIVYKAEGLPFGTTQEALQSWLKSIAWEATPIRALGPQSWLLRTANHPDSGVPMFNCQLILLRHLPAKIASTIPVVIGSKSAKSSVTPLPPLQGDPWAGYKGPQVPMVSRSSDGPIETRLSQQDAKIEQLQHSLDKVASAHESLATITTQKFEQQAARETENPQKVANAMDTLKKDIDESLQQVAQQNAKVMDSRLNELKQLLMRSSKRACPSEDDDTQTGS